jgi:hypothetical protein
MGVSCEDQKASTERNPLLLKTPAAVRLVGRGTADSERWILASGFFGRSRRMDNLLKTASGD